MGKLNIFTKEIFREFEEGKLVIAIKKQIEAGNTEKMLQLWMNGTDK